MATGGAPPTADSAMHNSTPPGVMITYLATVVGADPVRQAVPRIAALRVCVWLMMYGMIGR